MAWLSQSSTAYLGLAAFAVVFAVNWLRRTLSPYTPAPDGLKWEAIIVLVAALTLLGLAAAVPHALDYIYDKIDVIIFKKASRSPMPNASCRLATSGKPDDEADDSEAEDDEAPAAPDASARPPVPKKRRAGNIITEDSCALAFAERFKDELRFDHDAGKWHVWDGSIWRQNSTWAALHYARELVRDATATEKERVRFIASKVAFAASVERFAKADPRFAVTTDYWNRDPFLLGTPGCG